jgi:FkbM family methyltransferase
MTADLIRVRVQLPHGGDEQFRRFGPGWSDLLIREGTTDEAVLDEVFIADVYRVRGLDLTPIVSEFDDGRTKTEGRTVIDLGACTGIFSSLCLSFGASHVIAVEPQPDNAALLRKNLERGGERVTTIEAAVTGDGQPVQLFGSKGTGHTERSRPDVEIKDGAGRIVRTVSDHVPIVSYTLEHIIAMAPTPIALLKCDIEGAEFEVFNACPSEVLARVENIAMEFHGPKTAAPLDPAMIDDAYGALLAKLAHTHAVTVFGTPDAGGMLFAHRYDQ